MSSNARAVNAVCVIWNCLQIAHTAGCGLLGPSAGWIDAGADDGVYRGGWDGSGS